MADVGGKNYKAHIKMRQAKLTTSTQVRDLGIMLNCTKGISDQGSAVKKTSEPNQKNQKPNPY